MVCGQFRVTYEMLRFWMGGTGSASVDGLVPGLFRVPRDVRVHWQSQCHPTVTFQSERHHAQEPFGASVATKWRCPIHSSQTSDSSRISAQWKTVLTRQVFRQT